jgi:hypothetical protein
MLSPLRALLRACFARIGRDRAFDVGGEHVARVDDGDTKDFRE